MRVGVIPAHAGFHALRWGPQLMMLPTDWGLVSNLCRNCQTANDSWRPFCTQCGASMAAAAAASGDGAVPPPPPPLTAPGFTHDASWVGPWQPPVPPTAGAVGAPLAAPRRQSKRRVAAISGLCIALAGGAAFAGYTLVRHEDPYPKQWDARVAPLAQEAARLRGLSFKHAVKATFHTDAEFTKLVTNEAKPTAEDRKQLDRYAAAIRAVGLAAGDLDLRQESNTLRGSGVLAYYDPDSKQIHIRGTEMTVNLRVTLVHELVHALQDQNFDLLKMQRLAKTNQTDAIRSLYEGDARWVENEYVEKSLTKKEQRDFEKQSATEGDDFNDKAKNVPDILVLDQQAAYEFGSSAIAMLRNKGGQSAVDAVFRKPPTSDFLMMNPIWLLEQRTPAEIPKLKEVVGDTDYEKSGEFGAVWWFSMLSERIDFHEALAALDGWGSDTSALFDRAGVTCVSIGWYGTGGSETQRMQDALEKWRRQMPDPSQIKIERADDHTVLIEACDPGKSTSDVTHRAKDAFALPLYRAGFAAAFIDDGAKPHDAWCAADKALQPFNQSDLDDGAKFFETDAFQANLARSIKSCNTADEA